MLLHGVGNGDVKGVVIKGESGGVAFQEFNPGDVFPAEGHELAVPVHGGDLRVGIPSVQGGSEGSGAAADFQDLQVRMPVQPKGLLILIKEHVVESQLAAQVQRHHALDVIRPDIVGAHGWLISFGFRLEKCE